MPDPNQVGLLVRLGLHVLRSCALDARARVLAHLRLRDPGAPGLALASAPGLALASAPDLASAPAYSAAYAHAATDSSSSFSSLSEYQRAVRADVPREAVRRVVWVRRDVLPRFQGSWLLVRRLLLARSASPTTATARASAVGPAPPTAPGAAPDP